MSELTINPEDAVLLKSAAEETTVVVAGRGSTQRMFSTNAVQSGSSRAWTLGGQVD